MEGRRALALNGRAVALVDLAEVLQLPSGHRDSGGARHGVVVVLGVGEQTVAFVVNEVLDEREVLVKRLAKPLSRVRNIAGATILGSGEVTPILNVPDLLKSARTAGAARAGARLERGCLDAASGRRQADPGRRGFDHLAHAAEGDTRVGGLRGEHRSGRYRRVHDIAVRTFRSRRLGCGDAAPERVRSDREDPRRSEPWRRCRSCS